MIELTSDARYELKGRGTVYSIKGVPGLNPRSVQATDVLLDGRVVHVIGVEVVGIGDPTGYDFGILVREKGPGATP